VEQMPEMERQTVALLAMQFHLALVAAVGATTPRGVTIVMVEQVRVAW
jgi:hypothetical protein